MMQKRSSAISTEQARKLAELERLLNDPDTPMDPMRVWSLLDETRVGTEHGVERGEGERR